MVFFKKELIKGWGHFGLLDGFEPIPPLYEGLYWGFIKGTKMSRLKQFTLSLFSGYLVLGSNILYTLASVPLALHYLGKAPFALWAVVSQVSGYLALIDLGMSGSISRILIDHKDDRSTGVYGQIVKTGILVGLAQGLIILAAGAALTIPASRFLQIPPDLHRDFIWIMLGQSALVSVNFSCRIFNQLLFAHQRLDLGNYGSTLATILSLGVMWACFDAGWGIYSFLASQAFLVMATLAVVWGSCLHLGLFPSGREWGTLSRERFKEMFAFGQGVFLISVGSQFINTSQTLLISRLLGLDAVATWTICTRAYSSLTTLVWRVMDFSIPVLSEMFVRNERDRLRIRIQDISILMTSLSILCGTLFAVANGSFVRIWVHSRAGWPVWDDILLVLWFVACTLMRVHTGLVGITKKLHFLRFIYLLEGSVFLLLNLALHRVESITLMLSLSLACTLSFTLPYGLARSSDYFKLGWLDLLAWVRPSWSFTWRLVPLAAVVWWMTRHLPDRWRLALNLAFTGGTGLILFLRHGLDSGLTREIGAKLPPFARRSLMWVSGSFPNPSTRLH